MSLEGITIENSISLWTLPDILVNTVISPVLIFFAGIFLLAGLSLGIDYEISATFAFSLLAFTLISPFIAIFRNQITIKTFWRIGPEIFVEVAKLLSHIINIFGIVVVLALFVGYCIPEETRVYSDIVFFLACFVLFSLVPFYQIFGTAITNSGKIRIAFEALFSNLNNYDERQERLKKVFTELEKKLRKGNIKVSRDKLIYYCNLKLMKSEDVMNNLREIEHWMLREHTENIANSIKQIIPEEEIKPIEKISLLGRFYQIPSDLRKYVFLAIIAAIVLVFKPELVEKLIGEIL